jgi:RNA polymerase sigma-70 factor (ECF subfamily)
MTTHSPSGPIPDRPSAAPCAQNVPPSKWIEEQFTTLERPLVAYTRRHLGGDVEVAREIVQEAFAKLCVQAWPEIQLRVTAWMYKTCRHHAIDITRRNGRIAMLQLGNNISSLHDGSRQAAQCPVELSDELSAMRHWIETLTDQQQEVLRLRLKDGLSYQQIAEVTNLSASNVGYHLHQAVTALRNKLHSIPGDSPT